MGRCCKLFLLSIPIVIAYLYLKVSKTDRLPKIQDEYWGPKSEQGKEEDTSIRPFKIAVPASDLNDLKTRLKRELDSNRLVPPLEGVGFEYGFNSNYLKKVGQYWLEKYDWKAREKLLNKYPQFKTKIGGLDIHFYHIKPKSKKGVETRPILVSHGWPGSIVEYQKIIPLLSEPQISKYSYELVIPSLPGYGFSSGARRPGFGFPAIATIFRQLMERLGHKKFYAMGGDLGAGITSDLATIYPKQVLGAHSINCFDISEIGQIKHIISSTFPSFLASPEVAKHIIPWTQWFSFLVQEMGYLHIQATKPDTVGVALTHSPLGLAAYVLEKFSTWTNRSYISKGDGGLLEKFTLDELLDNVMVYWVTGSITTSQRLYSESVGPIKVPNTDRVPTNVPFGCMYMPEDVFITSQYAVRSKFTNIKRFSVAPKGGHFGGFEEPEILAEDALSFFNSL